MTTFALFAVAVMTVLTAFAWAHTASAVRRQSRQIKTRMGIKGRWDDAWEVDDDELLLDPSVPLPERRSMVLFIGDIFDDSERGKTMRVHLKAADIDLKPSETLALLVVAALGSFVLTELLLRQGPIVDGVIAVVVAVIVPALVFRSRRDRRLQNFTKQIPAIAELMSNALRAGMALQGAMEVVAREIGDPAGEEFGLLIREVRLGGSIDDSLEALLKRMPSAELEIMVTALKVQRVAGGNLIKSMSALARTLDERQRTHEEIKTLMTEPKFASYLMPVLAVGALAILNHMVPGFLDVLFRTIPGILVLTIFILLQVGGFLLIQRISRIKV
jgi:tight adherence protein B